MRKSSNDLRILSIAPSTRGFGYAVIEGETLVDWGVKTVGKDKNAESLKKIEEVIGLYKPQVITLQNVNAKDSRRAPRIRKLIEKIVVLAQRRKVRTKMFSRKEVMRLFFVDGKATKYDLARFLAVRFPEELGSRLPPKRRPWMSEDSRMDIFDAVAFGLRLVLSMQGS